MSRLNFDYLSTAYAFEPASANAGSVDTAGAFDEILQRAQKTTNSQHEPERPTAAGAGRDSETSRSADSARTTAEQPRRSPDDETKTSPHRAGEDSGPAETANDAADVEEEAVAESGDADADGAKQDRPDAEDAAGAAAVAAAAQAQAEPNAGPAGELILSDAASTLAVTDGITSGMDQPPSSAGADQSADTKSVENAPTSPWVGAESGVPAEPAPGQPSTEGQLAADLPRGATATGDAAEGVPQQDVAPIAKASTGNPAEQTATSANLPTDEPLAATATAAGVPQAETVAAQSVTEDNDSGDKTSQAGKAAAGGLQASGDSEAHAPSAKTKSSSLSQDEASANLAPDPTAPREDKKVETAETAGKTSSSDTAGGEVSPVVRGATTSQSATVPQGDGQTVSSDEQANRVRFVQRVARAFESAGGDGGSVRLQLSPPELGSLRLEVTLKNGAMHAHVEADTPAARNLLLDNLPALRERLAEQNIKVEQFDVDLTDQGRSGSWQQPSDQPRPETRQAEGGSRPLRQRESTVESVLTAKSAPRYGEGAGFDVTI